MGLYKQIAIALLVNFFISIYIVPAGALEGTVTIRADPNTHDTIVGQDFTFTAVLGGDWGNSIGYYWSVTNDKTNPNCPADGSITGGESIQASSACTGTHIVAVIVHDETGHTANATFPIKVHDQFEIADSKKSTITPEGFQPSTGWSGPGGTISRTESTTRTNSISLGTAIGGTSDSPSILKFLQIQLGYSHEVSSTVELTYSHEISPGKYGTVFYGPAFDMTEGHVKEWKGDGTFILTEFTGKKHIGPEFRYKEVDDPSASCSFNNTATGQNIQISPDTNISLNFNSVLACGDTWATAYYNNQWVSLPARYTPVRFYDITSTGAYSDYITINVTYTESDIPPNMNENSIRLFHYENGNWVDVTTALDTKSNTVTGRVMSLSPFSAAGILSGESIVAGGSSFGLFGLLILSTCLAGISIFRLRRKK